MGLVGLAATPWVEKAIATQHGMAKGNPAGDVQFEMQEKMQAVTHRYWGSSLGPVLANLVLSGGLLAGGILALRMAPKSRKFLIAVFLAGIVFEIVRVIVQSHMQIDMAAVISDSMSRMMQTAAPKGRPGADQAAAFASMAAKVGVFVGLAVTVIFGLAKVIFYVVGVLYLRRPMVRRLFREEQEGFAVGQPPYPLRP